MFLPVKFVYTANENTTFRNGILNIMHIVAVEEGKYLRVHLMDGGEVQVDDTILKFLMKLENVCREYGVVITQNVINNAGAMGENAVSDNS